MSKLDFTGRYYTEAGTLVAVHNYVANDMKYWGHEIRLVAPFATHTKYYWDESGKCLLVQGEHINISNNEDLMIRVNPQSIAASAEVVDCEECREYQAIAKGVKSGKFGNAASNVVPTVDTVVGTETKQVEEIGGKKKSVGIRVLLYEGDDVWMEATYNASISGVFECEAYGVPLEGKGTIKEVLRVLNGEVRNVC